VNPVTDNGEQPAPSSLKVVVNTGTGSSSVTLTMPNLSVNSWKIYRSTSQYFPDPSYIGSTTSNTFTDTLASPSSGNPPSEYGEPVKLRSTTSTYVRLAREKFISKIKYDKLERYIGWESVNSYWMMVRSDVTISIGDLVLFNGDYYEVTAIFPFYWRGTLVLQRATIEERQPE